MLMDVMIASLAGERHEPEPKHVEGGEERAAGHRIKQDRVPRVGLGEGERLREDRILGVVARQADHERDARSDDRQAANEHRAGRVGHHLRESAHLSHVVGVAGVDHGTRAEKEQAFEERMRHQVEQTGDPAADTQREHHVTELAHGGVRQHPLDVVGDQGDRGGDEQGDRPRVGDHQQHVGREHGEESAHEIDPCRDHRRRVHQRRDRRGPFHGIREPDRERKLSALSHAAAEDSDSGDEQQPATEALGPPGLDLPGDRGHGGAGHLVGSRKLHHPVRNTERMPRFGRPHEAEQPGHGRCLAVRPHDLGVGEVQGAKRPPQGHQPDQHPEVTYPVDDERLVGGGGGRFPLVVEADEEPGTDAHQFPENEHHCQIAGDQDAHHRKAEQR